MEAKEKSAMIRAALKKAGFNARQVSVRVDYGCCSVAFKVTIRDKNIDKAEIEKIVYPFKEIYYDEWGEILSGCDYVFVRYA